ncbi:MAG: universal stress protein [Candidatus Neomarinimicrobiota bacterium]
MAYKKILVALSCTGKEIALIDEAVRLANTLNAELHVLHVNHPHAGEMSMMMESTGHKFNEEEIKKIFREAGHEEIAAGMDVKIRVNSSVLEEVADCAKEMDLLMLGHTKLGGVTEYISDTIDERIVNHVDCPVLIVPKS